MKDKSAFISTVFLSLFLVTSAFAQIDRPGTRSGLRERISINNDWLFFKYDSISKADNLIYDVRPEAKVEIHSK